MKTMFFLWMFPARKMWEQYRAMRSSNCRNCDKYFHCKGNYNAVYSCSGNRSANRRTAETIRYAHAQSERIM